MKMGMNLLSVVCRPQVHKYQYAICIQGAYEYTILFFFKSIGILFCSVFSSC
jgi:hypothetical protein